MPMAHHEPYTDPWEFLLFPLITTESYLEVQSCLLPKHKQEILDWYGGQQPHKMFFEKQRNGDLSQIKTRCTWTKSCLLCVTYETA